jgi:hypothetical protein
MKVSHVLKMLWDAIGLIDGIADLADFPALPLIVILIGVCVWMSRTLRRREVAPW